jgi:hypothetical protein
MPVIQKSKHDDDLVHNMVDIEEVEVVLHQLSEDKEDAITKYFAPKSSIAKDLYEKRKELQIRKKAWMDTIIRRQMDLQTNLAKLRESTKSQTNNVQSISPLHLTKVTSSHNSTSAIAI